VRRDVSSRQLVGKLRPQLCNLTLGDSIFS
jgi:hypothetical protein